MFKDFGKLETIELRSIASAKMYNNIYVMRSEETNKNVFANTLQPGRVMAVKYTS